jgi:hypothetical protein
VCRLVFDQRLETWLQCHAETFAALGDGRGRGHVREATSFPKALPP